jgi:hypothetical protein
MATAVSSTSRGPTGSAKSRAAPIRTSAGCSALMTEASAMVVSLKAKT